MSVSYKNHLQKNDCKYGSCQTLIFIIYSKILWEHVDTTFSEMICKRKAAAKCHGLYFKYIMDVDFTPHTNQNTCKIRNS